MKELLSEIYCLDTNVLIEAWNTYYSPALCPDYWAVLNELGAKRLIFIPQEVYEEIAKQDDGLSDWLKNSNIPIHSQNEEVCINLKNIYAKDASHVRLVDSTKQRSLADPWVIAHAMTVNATVVTKEALAVDTNKKVKIPNVCDNMEIRWINDFRFIQELNIRFSCNISAPK